MECVIQKGEQAEKTNLVPAVENRENYNIPVHHVPVRTIKQKISGAPTTHHAPTRTIKQKISAARKYIKLKVPKSTTD